MILFSECVFAEENQQPILGGHRFFRRKVTIFIGREINTHILPTKSTKTNSLKSASLTIINYSFRIINHSTTTTKAFSAREFRALQEMFAHQTHLLHNFLEHVPYASSLNALIDKYKFPQPENKGKILSHA